MYKLLCLFLLIITAGFMNSCHSGGSGGNNSQNNSSTASSAAITQLSLNGSLGIITGQNIAVIMPFGTTVTNLIATYTINGKSVTVGGVTQTSGVTTNNFTNPVQYIVTASDGTSTTYTVTVSQGTVSSNALIQFSLQFSLVSNLGAAPITGALGVINGQNINVIMPYGTDVTKLIANFITNGSTVSVNGTAQISGVTVNNFTNPLTYKVKASNGNLASYIVNVTVAPNIAKVITQFSLNGTSGVINGQTISVIMPFGTSLNSLIATYVTTGNSITVNGITQTNGITANNFSSPLVYTVIAANQSSVPYTVNVTVAQKPNKAITAFSLNGNVGSTSGLIIGQNINLIMPFGTDVTSLIATFTTTGTNVKVKNISQTSSLNSNDFTNPVQYVVSASDGSTTTYTVNVTVATNINKAITAYSLNGISGIISGSNINVILPFGTIINGLVATYTTTGVNVSINNTSQTSTLTPNDFTSPVQYIVTAADSSVAGYLVTVTVASNPAKDILRYSLNGTVGVITGYNIAVTVPSGTDVTSLIATYTTTGANVAIGSIPQTSSATANDFTNPVAYTVTAADGSKVSYIVTVTVASNSAKAITSYSLNGATGTITGTNIAVIMPFGTSVTSLIATFTTTGANVAIGGTTQTSSASANNFTGAVTYIVTATDGSTQNYIVTVTVALNSAKDITAYSLNGTTGTITGQNIAVTMPFGTNVTALIATFTTSGTSVAIGGTAQTSTVTSNNFTSPVTYTVTAADSSTQNYIVTVTIAPSPAKAITAFSLNGTAGTITGTNIAVQVPFGTNVTALTATFTTTGASVAIGGVPQTSALTSNNFTSPVTYTVTAADSTTQNYIVTVTVALNSAKAITAYSLNGTAGTITGTNIAVVMPNGTNVTALTATFTTTGASVAIGGVPQTSALTSNNFTSPVTYTVTASDSTTLNYIVTVTVAASSAKQFLTYSINGVNGTINNVAFTIAVSLSGTAVNSLIATFTLSAGATAKVAATTQVSGTTANNFTSPVTYTVTAADGSTQNYIVTVTVTNNYAYISTVGFTQACIINTATGAFSTCSATTLNAQFGGLVINGSLIYGVNANSNSVQVCTLNAGTGTTSACGNTGATGLSGNAANALAFTTVAGGTYAYITNGTFIQKCTVNTSTGSFSACVNSGAGAYTSIQSFTTNGTFAYFNDFFVSGLYTCSINSSTGILSGCSLSGGALLSAVRALTASGNYIYGGTAGGVYSCQINGAGLNNCVTTANSTSNTYGVAAFMGFLYGSGPSVSSASSCVINAGTGALSGCTANATVPPGYAIVIQ